MAVAQGVPTKKSKAENVFFFLRRTKKALIPRYRKPYTAQLSSPKKNRGKCFPIIKAAVFWAQCGPHPGRAAWGAGTTEQASLGDSFDSSSTKEKNILCSTEFPSPHVKKEKKKAPKEFARDSTVRNQVERGSGGQLTSHGSCFFRLSRLCSFYHICGEETKSEEQFLCRR